MFHIFRGWIHILLAVLIYVRQFFPVHRKLKGRGVRLLSVPFGSQVDDAYDKVLPFVSAQSLLYWNKN